MQEDAFITIKNYPTLIHSYSYAAWSLQPFLDDIIDFKSIEWTEYVNAH